MLIDTDFNKWIKSISTNYKNAQIKASIKVNSELIMFYFNLGKEISTTSYKAKYGNEFYNNLAIELKKELPSATGLSTQNIRYCELFYTKYKKILPQVVGKLGIVPWGHHRILIDKCKTIDKALFYLNKTIENNWSRSMLLNILDTNLYERSLKSVNNFETKLPSAESDLAKELIRDPYNFSFLEIRDKHDEKELKTAISNNIEKFLLELGNGFAYVGREVKLVVGETELFCDMVFYNIKLHSYVIIEVKTTSFKPEYLGQLCGYVGTANHTLRGEGDGPTIGLLICKDKNNVLAQYTLETTNVPLGISEYQLSKLIPEDFKSSMPTIEEIENELK